MEIFLLCGVFVKKDLQIYVYSKAFYLLKVKKIIFLKKKEFENDLKQLFSIVYYLKSFYRL